MTAELSTSERDTWRAFFVMRRQLELTLERRLQADAGISSADYEVLISLFEASDKRLRAGQIGDIIGWEKSRVSHQISRMEARGLVVRQECGDDARGVWVVITADGSRAVLEALRDRTAAIRENFFDVLTPDEVETLKTISTRVLDTINPPICDEVKATAVTV
jgi:DNA-binding MarR family transcriptional regulator